MIIIIMMLMLMLMMMMMMMMMLMLMLMLMLMMFIVYCQIHALPFGIVLRPSIGSYQISDIQNPKPVLKRTQINNTHIQSICKRQSALKRNRCLRVDGLERAIPEGNASTIMPVFWREKDCDGFGEERGAQFAIGHDVEGEKVNDSCCKNYKRFWVSKINVGVLVYQQLQEDQAMSLE